MGILIESRPISVNLVLTRKCNYRCEFCFGHLEGISGNIDTSRIMEIPSLLADAGCEKITFEGGEPFLCPFLEEIVTQAHNSGLTTCIVSNGSLITYSRLCRLAPSLDWLGLSIDSGDERVEKELGRGYGSHLSRCLEVVSWVKDLDIWLKINTVVTSRNYSEDMVDLISTLRPERWKVFQVLLIRGENEYNARHLRVTTEQFEHFLKLNRKVKEVGVPMIAEAEIDMIGSYIMLLPDGRFFSNHGFRHEFGAKSIFDYGVEEAFAEVGWDEGKFDDRGGRYLWNRPTSNILKREVIT